MTSILAHAVADESALERVFHALTGVDHLIMLTSAVFLFGIVFLGVRSGLVRARVRRATKQRNENSQI